MRLYAWTRPDERGGSVLVGTIEVGPAGARLETCRDPGLAAVFAEVAAQDYLPLTIRQQVGASRHVRNERLTPSDAQYWRALAEALSRRTGHKVTDAETPPDA